ncbi:putative F-box/LRR-repeat protein At5g02700 [Coffea arabica]|uniref:F-box/LRR-repeat protein At5g02700 n=1 Tax=Coffea arabica TaxID=13443 RepID=A0ABM4W933_COFAR
MKSRLLSLLLELHRILAIGWDWINQLPEEILRNTLSLMVMKEAARTCILSRRQRNLWKVFSSHLDFDAFQTMRLIFDGSLVEQLRIAIDLGESYATAVDKWINFAIVRRVQRLEVDQTAAAGCYTSSDSVYTFPSWLLDLPFDFPSFDRLTSLCKVLYLPNNQATINIRFIEVPELALVSFGNEYREKFITNSPSTLYLARLEKLELDLRLMDSARCVGFPTNFPEFSNLKHFGIEICSARRSGKSKLGDTVTSVST